ncbi:MAG: hypothetical protein PHC84_05890, partial [Clostridia bacterium]|nr:hypothetical protein [Clostridia bacterium]
MKPFFISIDGILNKGKEYLDLTTKTANLVAISYADINELRELLSLGLYGNGIEGKIELGYEYNGEEYIVKRDFDNNTAELSCKDGGLSCSGVEEVNKQIFAQIKMERSSFGALAVIDRDRIFDGFQLPAEAREEYMGSILDELMCNKEEISTIEQKLQEKYDKTMLRLEITEEVNPKELADLKAEINEKNILRQDIRTEIDTLYEAIKKAEVAEDAAKQLQVEKEELAKALDKKPLIDELGSLLAKSDRAELISMLHDRKARITERDKELETRAAFLAEAARKCESDIASGAKSVKNVEGVLVHCLERISELRKVLYKRVDELSNDGDFQSRVYNQVDKYYSKEQQELLALSQRKTELNEELEAISLANKDINLRFQEIARRAELKKAVREGAVLEKEMKLLGEAASSAGLSIEVYEKRLAELLPELAATEQKLTNEKAGLQKMHSFITGGFATFEESLSAAATREQEFRKYDALIRVQEQEADAVEKKIQENADGLKSYFEDMEALNKAKTGLDAYINKIKGTISALEDAIQKLELDRKNIYQIIELEYGQKCPLCSSVVLNKKDEQKRAAEVEAQIAKANNELTKAKGILTEYEDKSRQISFRNGELTARIKISEAYIKSLQENLSTKKEYIRNALKQAAVKSSFDLAEKVKAATEYRAQLIDATKRYAETEGEIKVCTARLDHLSAAKKRLEEEYLPRF